MVTKDAEVVVSGEYFQATQSLDDGDDMDLNPGNEGIDEIEIHNITHGNDCDVKLRVDSTGDGTFNREVTLDSFTGAGISQGNEIEVGSDGDIVFRITDTSGGSDNDYIVTGELL